MALAQRLARYHRYGMLFFHLGAAASLTVVPSRRALVLFAVSYAARTLGITAGYHRYFTHRTFETSRPVAFVLGLLGGLAAQGTISRWVHHHWKHHRYVEREGDPHSPLVGGFWHAHAGWLFDPSTFEDEEEAIRRRRRWPTELRLLDRAIPALLPLSGVLLYAVGGFEFLAWGWFLPIVLLMHATFLVNSLGHSAGRRMFETDDGSRNHLLTGLLVFGDGWHNNHHAWPKNARFGLRLSQPDVAFWFIKCLEMVGLAWNVTTRSEAEIRTALASRRRAD